MASAIGPEKRHVRRFFTYVLPGLFFATLLAAIFAVAVTGDPLAGNPLYFAGGGLCALLWVPLMWASTPSEREYFARQRQLQRSRR